MSKSIGRQTLICQCLSSLPLEDFNCPLMDYDYDKLSTKALLKIFVAAQLDKWSSYPQFEEKLDAYPKLKKELDLTGISASQLSRRINDLPTELVQKLFVRVIMKIQELTQKEKGITKNIGILKIIDSTQIKLPKTLCDWANISKGYNAVKMHTRLVVVSKNTVYPDKIIPSSGIVGDSETASELVEARDATYVMDRGYPTIKNLMDWLEREISFVARVSQSLRLYSLEEYEPTHPSVIRDAKVNFGVSNEPVRYIEFVDEHQRVYRILTTRWDLTDQEIMEIYKHRWMIELFFKWVKQHLKLTKIWSTKPQGIWNQMFLALIAYGLCLIVKLETGSTKTLWDFFQLLQIYLYKTWSSFIKALKRKKTKTSRGRQKVPIPLEKKPIVFGTVAMYKEKRKK